jgi:hypothetical protein
MCEQMSNECEQYVELTRAKRVNREIAIIEIKHSFDIPNVIAQLNYQRHKFMRSIIIIDMLMKCAKQIGNRQIDFKLAHLKFINLHASLPLVVVNFSCFSLF